VSDPPVEKYCFKNRHKCLSPYTSYNVVTVYEELVIEKFVRKVELLLKIHTLKVMAVNIDL